MVTAWVVELVDTQDLKSCGRKAVRVQFPSRVLKLRALHLGGSFNLRVSA